MDSSHLNNASMLPSPQAAPSVSPDPSTLPISPESLARTGILFAENVKLKKIGHDLESELRIAREESRCIALDLALAHKLYDTAEKFGTQVDDDRVWAAQASVEVIEERDEALDEAKKAREQVEALKDELANLDHKHTLDTRAAERRITTLEIEKACLSERWEAAQEEQVAMAAAWRDETAGLHAEVMALRLQLHAVAMELASAAIRSVASAIWCRGKPGSE
ncbi:hypothetical protein OF83DRAFT_1088580 [Amylostereum chailletii]|nr:hypothetical protein OF83DRAFT_1088580 [Amylostereum chailletii]